MKILHLIYSFEVGGAETMLVDIMNGQAARGHEVVLLIVNSGVNESLISTLDPKVKVVRMNRREGSAPLLMMARLNLLLLRLKPDIIHGHHHKFGRLVQFRRGHLLLTIHDMNQSMKYCSGSRMVAITEAVAADILSRVPSADVTTILNGIRTSDIVLRADGVPGKPFCTVQVARLMAEKKGQDVLIRALGELKRRGRSDFDATFIGIGDDETMLRELAEKEGVADSVHFAGLRSRDYIYSHLAEFDAMVHPSRYEGFGLTVAEGMAARLPLIVTEGDGPWEVCDRGRLCESVAVSDHKGLADALVRVADGYPRYAERACEAKTYVKRFDIATTVDNYLNYYSSMLKK